MYKLFNSTGRKKKKHHTTQSERYLKKYTDNKKSITHAYCESSKAELMWSLHTFWFFTCSLFSIFRLKNPKTGPKKGNSNCCSLFFSKGLVSLRAHSSNSVFKKIKSNKGTQMFTTTIFRGDLPTPKQPLWCHAQPWLHRGTPSWYRAAKNPQCQKAEIKFSVLCGNPAGFHDTGSLQLSL